VAQQGPPPRHPARPPASGWPEQPATRRRAAGYGGQDRGLDSGLDDLDQDELPPWAGLSISPRRPGRESRPPRQDLASPRPRWAAQSLPGADAADAAGDTDDLGPLGPAGPSAGRRPRRAVAARARKARRKIYIWGGAGIAAALIAIGAVLLFGPKPAAPRHSNFVTTYQPGDFRAVPSACHAVPAATLDQYLPGTRSRVVSASLGGNSTESQCTWTLDARPLFRVLEVTAQAYGPSLLATGNGSATFSAIDSYDAARQGLASPPKPTHKPKATITPLPGLGNIAFSALQVVHDGRGRTDLVTVVVRVHNALVTVAFQGLDHTSRGGYGPVSTPRLQAGAVAAAREVIAGLH
jgi:hypothetical protein